MTALKTARTPHLLQNAMERVITNTVSNAVSAALGASALANTGLRLAGRAVRRAGRRVSRTRAYPAFTMTRHTSPFSVSLTAGSYTAATTVNLSAVQVSDLIAMYDMYKINWVEFRLIPNYDPAQSGVTNNTDVWVAAACDPTGQVTAPTWAQITAFEGHRVAPLLAGREFRFRFKPRAINALQAGNYAINNNDWLILSSSGAAVAHQSLIWNIVSNSASNVTSFSFTFAINFSVRQSK